jgi:tetratricopeptide (TPR) repeat protein/DNA-binding SARP family transcriptional activator
MPLGGVVDIRLLGNVEIHSDAGVLRPRRSGERCVLAVLALHVQASVTVTTLVDHLWSGTEQSDKSIDTVGSYLRRIRAGIKQAGGQADWLRYDRAARSCVLDIDPAWVDYHRFTALSTRARQDNDPQALQEALALWRGPALADINGHWADHRRHALEAERLAVYDELLTEYLAAGRHAEVVRITAELVDEVTPTDRLLLLGAQALAGSGRHTAISGWVRHVIGRMRQTADATPAAEVLDELDQITAHPTRVVPAPESGAASAMFSMRADISTFTGRDKELHSLLDTVLATLPGDDRDADDGVRAIAIHTVDGMPGVGKTAFSVHTAHRLAHRFPDGNLFLDLRGHTPGQYPLTPGAALESLLRAAGVDPKMIPPTLEDRARLWRDRMAGKKVLLVLDDAADHEQVRPLLPGTAGNLVLITSRHRLAALDGVTSLTLDVLPPDQAIALLVRLAGRTPDQEAGVARIVAYCGYLPLAITLAGAQLRCHPSWRAGYLADLLAVEHDRLEHLDVGDRSVRATFDMSFRHRPATQQRLFRLLGVHPGPEIDVFATAALTSNSLSAARRGLAGLHADHLVEETAPGRYRLHDLLRVYARTLATDLDPDDRRNALDRVVAYYLHTVQTANTHLPAYHTSPLSPIITASAQAPCLDDLSAAQGWLAAELPTLTACVHHAAAGSNTQPAIHLATALHPFLRVSGYTEHALDVYQTALTAARDINDRAGQATALIHLGDVQDQRGEYAAATDSHTQAGDLYAAVGDRLGLAAALDNLGRVRCRRGEFTAAIDSHTRALDLYIAVGSRLGQANALTNLGRVQDYQGEYAAATDNLTRALDLYVAVGDRLGQANALTDLGRLQRLRGEFPAAIDSYTRALDLYATVGDRLGLATALTNLGTVQHQRGEYAAAADNLTRALNLYTAVGSRLGQAGALSNLGTVQHQRGEYAAATDTLTRALDLYTALGERLGQANTLTFLGHVQDQQGEFPAAIDSHTRALDLYTALGSRLGQANALTNLGRVQHQRGEYAAATDNHTHALDLFTSTGDPDGQAETLNNMGDLALDHSEAGDPHAYFSRALTIAQDIGAAIHQAHAMAGQARCLLLAADTTQAVALLRRAHSLYDVLGVPEAIEIQTLLSTLDKHTG